MRGWRRTVPRPERSARGGMCGGEEASRPLSRLFASCCRRSLVQRTRCCSTARIDPNTTPQQQSKEKEQHTKPQPIDPPNYVFALSVVAACGKKSRFDRQPIKARLDSLSARACVLCVCPQVTPRCKSSDREEPHETHHHRLTRQQQRLSSNGPRPKAISFTYSCRTCACYL